MGGPLSEENLKLSSAWHGLGLEFPGRMSLGHWVPLSFCHVSTSLTDSCLFRLVNRTSAIGFYFMISWGF